MDVGGLLGSALDRGVLLEYGDRTSHDGGTRSEIKDERKEKSDSSSDGHNVLICIVIIAYPDWS